MNSLSKYFPEAKKISIDKFISNALYDEEHGYYSKKIPFGKNGDFITSPGITSLFSELIGLWVISLWEHMGKPKIFNVVELGPGNGQMCKTLLGVFKKFPIFFNAVNIFLYEKSKTLQNLQKNNLNDKKVNWVKNFNKIKKGPIIFLGNEFFDAIPIKQFKNEKKCLFEKYYTLNKKNQIRVIFKKASKKDTVNIKSYKSLKNLKFIEFPKYGFNELKKIKKKILQLNGCILMIDYGYLNSSNQNTLQSVMSHKKNNMLNNLGKADITSHVNFKLLNEFFLKNNLKVEKIISQQRFLKNMGIIKRAEIISKKMKFIDQSNIYLRLKRLLSPILMGELFKVILAYKFKSNKFFGFK